MAGDQKIIDKAVADRQEFFRLINDQKIEWEHCRHYKGVTITRTVGDTSDHHRRGHIFKGEALFNAQLDEVAHMIHPSGPYRIQWDSHLLGVKVLKKLTKNLLIVHHMAKPHLMGIIGKRDSVDVLWVDSVSPGNKYISMGSIEYEDCPPDENYVRAWSHPCGIMMDETEDPEVTRVQCIFHVDFNMPHLVPVSLMDATMPRELQHFFQRFREAPKKLKVTEQLELPGWF